MVTTMERREIGRWLEQQGFTLTMIDQRGALAQWYRADGTPLPNKMPADAYHLRRYRAKGWSLKAPPSVREGEAVHWDGTQWRTIPSNQTATNGVAAFQAHRTHLYGKEMGSRCKVPGCTKVRQVPFKKRGR